MPLFMRGGPLKIALNIKVSEKNIKLVLKTLNANARTLLVSKIVFKYISEKRLLFPLDDVALWLRCLFNAKF